MAHDEQVRMWECVLLTSGAAPLTAAGPLRWVPSLDGYRLPGATCRPRTRAKRGGNLGWRPRAMIPAPAPAPPADPAGQSRATGPSPAAARTQRHLPHGAGPPTSGPRHRGRTPGHTTASLLIARLHASSRHSTPARALHEYGRSCAPSTSGPVVPRITRRGSRKDVARWHVGLAFQVLDSKACHLPGGTGDGGEADVGESGQPRVVADDRDFLPRRRRPLPDSPRTVHPQHRAEDNVSS